jgi:hypothetical protein
MEEMLGTWAIVNTSMECLEIYEGDITQFDTNKYSDYGGEVGIHSQWIYREGAVGKVYNHEKDKFI